MAEISNFPSRKKNKGFLSTMTTNARTTAIAEPAVENAPILESSPADATSESAQSKAKKPPAHNTTVNLTVEQRAWLRWREVITKRSMGDLIRQAIDDQMNQTPMPPEVAAIFKS